MILRESVKRDNYYNCARVEDCNILDAARLTKSIPQAREL